MPTSSTCRASPARAYAHAVPSIDPVALAELRADMKRIALEVRLLERHIAWNRVIDDAIRVCRLVAKLEAQEAEKAWQDQPRVPAGNPDGGQWTDEGGGGGDAGAANDGVVLSDANPDNDWKPGAQYAQARGPQRTVQIGTRTVRGSADQLTQLAILRTTLQGQRERLRRLDPSWAPPTTVRDGARDVSAQQELTVTRNELAWVGARLRVIDRGDVPLAFAGREDFAAFSRTVNRGLHTAGYRDAVVTVRGSSVTGFNYLRGEAFDQGRRSDIDLAIVNPTLYQRAEQFRIVGRGRARSVALNSVHEGRLGLDSVGREMRAITGRKASFMIYRSQSEVEARGPFVLLP